MMRRTGTILFLCTALLALSVAGAAPGTTADPAVRRSYVDQVFYPALETYANQSIDLELADDINAINNLLDDLRSQRGPSGRAARQASRAFTFYLSGFTTVTLGIGDTLVGADGTMFILDSGTAHATGALVNLTTGGVSGTNSVVPARAVLAPYSGSGLMARTPCTVRVKGYYQYILALPPSYADVSQALLEMGIIRGSNLGLEAERAGTRVEGMTVMLTLFGEYDQAMNAGLVSPFTDLASWSVPLVGYANSKGYTSGTSANQYSPNDTIMLESYLTFVLAALGYDRYNEFVWNESPAFAIRVGLLTEQEVAAFLDYFNREALFYVSYKALSMPYKGTDTTLLERLIAQGVVDADIARAAMSKVR